MEDNNPTDPNMNPMGAPEAPAEPAPEGAPAPEGEPAPEGAPETPEEGTPAM